MKQTRRWLLVTVIAALASTALLFGYLRQGPPSLENAKAAADSGQLDSAADIAAQLNATAEVLDFRLKLALRRKRVGEALEAYRGLQAQGRSDAADLRAMGELSVEQLRQASDPTIVVSACKLVTNADCRAQLRELRDSPNAPDTVRVAAAAALAGDRAAQDEIVRSRSDALLQKDAVAAAEAAREMPAAAAVDLLGRVLKSTEPRAQYLAARTLGQLRDPAGEAPLRAFVKTTSSRQAEWAARIALASLGDQEQLAAVGDALQWLHGADLLMAGDALARSGDRRGVLALESILAGDDEMLRLDAAGALHAHEPVRSQETLQTGYGNANPWVRAHALSVAADLRLELPPSALGLVADQNEWVRMQATRLILGMKSGG